MEATGGAAMPTGVRRGLGVGATLMGPSGRDDEDRVGGPLGSETTGW